LLYYEAKRLIRFITTCL